MTSGVIYWLSGMKLALRLAVSLHSLRKHYSGPVTVIVNKNVHQDFNTILMENGFDIKPIDWPDGGKQAQLAKTAMNRFTPYDNTVFIDCDTLVVGKIDELFPLITQHGLVFVQFANWTSEHRSIKHRVGHLCELMHISPECRDKALAFGYAINIGVYGFKKEHAIWAEWNALGECATEAGVFIPDEASLQCIIWKYAPYVAENKFNVSMNRPGYLGTNPDMTDWRILHYAGRAHLAPKSKDFKNLWIDYGRSIWNTNAMNIREVAKRWRYKNEPDLIGE